ncbi:MAG: hypothetical protein OdinLCB4_004645 [Candidatus Odinarchaeum yellowstonii]|uniref:Haloacid dehalogenase n=1 Tax=Odinarchaeota yellowstonii (strain LCB_4) TaxID=1841599 RepID=A0AAF0D178_ODILC|nr:MAG: hypothetical protein OdinLCB4_004645 [Candidatus Odinarchaeum yellowstonii]
MELDKIIDSIRVELESEEQAKEQLVEKARLGIKACGDAIIHAHRNNISKSISKLEEASNLLQEINSLIEKQPEALNLSVIGDLYQEYVEAKLFIEFIERRLYPHYNELKVPGKYYALGLADLIGELRRYVLNAIRKDKLDEAEYALQVMEEIFDNIYSLESPKSLLNGLRRKCDIARSVLEKTRGDVTSAFSNSRLIKHVKTLFEKLSSIENKLDNSGGV